MCQGLCDCGCLMCVRNCVGFRVSISRASTYCVTTYCLPGSWVSATNPRGGCWAHRMGQAFNCGPLRFLPPRGLPWHCTHCSAPPGSILPSLPLHPSIPHLRTAACHALCSVCETVSPVVRGTFRPSSCPTIWPGQGARSSAAQHSPSPPSPQPRWTSHPLPRWSGPAAHGGL